MAYMKIYCGYCGGHWEVYERDKYNDVTMRTCPHCNSRIDGQTWESQILPAFGQVSDANRELIKDHTGYHVPLFRFDVIADHFFSDQDEYPE